MGKASWFSRIKNVVARAKRSDDHMVWHYTVGVQVPKISDAGELRPSNAGASVEKPLLWFSAEQHWEPTATKGRIDQAGNYRQMSFEEHLNELGCVRFGLSAHDQRLMGWIEACKYAGTPDHWRRALEKVGRDQGADPLKWFAVAVAISIDETTFEVYTNREWVVPE